MREIGVRELKQSLSETLRAVGHGEHVRVTRRGRPLADIVPVGAAAGEDRLRELVVSGQVMPPSRARPKRAPKLAESGVSAAALVLSERDAER